MRFQTNLGIVDPEKDFRKSGNGDIHSQVSNFKSNTNKSKQVQLEPINMSNNAGTPDKTNRTPLEISNKDLANNDEQINVNDKIEPAPQKRNYERLRSLDENVI